MVTKVRKKSKPVPEEEARRIKDQIYQKVQNITFEEWQLRENGLTYDWKEKGLIIHLKNETTSYSSTEMDGSGCTDYNWKYVLSVKRGSEELYQQVQTSGDWSGLKNLYHNIRSKKEEFEQTERRQLKEKEELEEKGRQERRRQEGLMTLKDILGDFK